jgi:MFS family permease
MPPEDPHPAPSLSNRFGLERVLLVGIAANAISMALLVASDTVKSDPAAFRILLLATAFLGAGFGLTLSAPSTFAGASGRATGRPRSPRSTSCWGSAPRCPRC